MKILIASLFFVASLFAWSGILTTSQTSFIKTSLVIIKIDKPNASKVSRAVAISAKHQGMTHEYNCSASGIVVFRYNHNLNERADVIQFFQKTLLKELPGIKTEIIFCDLMNIENVGKC